jgi:Tfp pilus assembly protein PilO
MFKEFNIDFDHKKKSIVLATAVAVLTVIICLNIIKSHSRKRDNLHQKIEVQSRKLALRRDINNIDKIYRKYADFFYNNINQQALRSVISDLAAETGVDIVSIKPLGKERIGGVTKESLGVSLRCTYNQLGLFIARIETLKHITKIESLIIAGEKDLDMRKALKDNAQKWFMDPATSISVSVIIAGYSIGD